ncbi:MAG: hypothetical protein LUE86_07385 [Clostridiales bacterium]|nr:hypothetical protein [Clostridiales bacterium]
MKRWMRMFAVIFMAGVMLVAGAGGVLAAETRQEITSISLEVTSTIVSGSSSGNVYITKADDGNYRVGSVEILNSSDDWIGGMTPRVSVNIYADNGYYFSSSSKNIFSFSGEDVTVESVSRQDDKTTIALKLKLPKLDNGDLTVTGPYWNENSGVAHWDENTSARYYQVRLYRNDSQLTTSKQTSDNEYDFSGSISKSGDYYFEVRAVGSSSEKGDWVSSDVWYVDAYEASYMRSLSSDSPGDSDWYYDAGPGGYSYGPGGYSYGPGGYSGGPGVTGGYVPTGPGATGGSSGSSGLYGEGATTANGNHWCLDAGGWWYQYADGGHPVSSFQQIDGVWYYFNDSGYITTGWFEVNGNWYYCDSSGALYINARTPDGYYVGGDGAWIQ